MKNDGGHAFPNITPDMNVDGGPGMSLRDYFAGQALVGLIARPGSSGAIRDFASDAYEAADAMLDARASDTQGEGE